jgi:FMN reductase (NADPH)
MSAAESFFELLRKRRMSRRFKPIPLAEWKLKKLLYAGNRAPTASNASYRRLMLITDLRLLRMLRSVAPGYSESIAAAVILIYTDLRLANAFGNKTHEPWSSRMDAGAAAENVHLASIAMGLGSCFFSSSSDEGLRELLGLPDYCRPEIMVSVGYPDENLPKPRKASHDAKVVYVDRYGREWNGSRTTKAK